MGEVLKFPGLGWEITLNPVAFTIGPLTINWYGIIIGLGFLLGIAYVMYRSKTFGIHPDKTIDIVIAAVFGAIIGARLYYVVFSWDYYKNNLLDVFKIWEGGLAIYGGIIGGAIAVWIICRHHKVKLTAMFDLAAGGLILGQAIGRWGNFVNIEAYGANTTLPWGMTSDSIVRYLSGMQKPLADIGVAVDPAIPVHPTFFYESIWCFIGFALLVLWTKRRRYDGQLTLFYFGWYSAGRMVIEGMRTDSLMWGTVRVSQLLAVILVIVTWMIAAVVRTRIRERNDPEYLKLYALTEESKAQFIKAEQPKKAETVIEEKEQTQVQTEDLPEEHAQEEEQDGGKD